MNWSTQVKTIICRITRTPNFDPSFVVNHQVMYEFGSEAGDKSWLSKSTKRTLSRLCKSRYWASVPIQPQSLKVAWLSFNHTSSRVELHFESCCLMRKACMGNKPVQPHFQQFICDCSTDVPYWMWIQPCDIHILRYCLVWVSIGRMSTLFSRFYNSRLLGQDQLPQKYCLGAQMIVFQDHMLSKIMKVWILFPLYDST